MPVHNPKYLLCHLSNPKLTIRRDVVCLALFPPMENNVQRLGCIFRKRKCTGTLSVAVDRHFLAISEMQD